MKLNAIKAVPVTAALALALTGCAVPTMDDSESPVTKTVTETATPDTAEPAGSSSSSSTTTSSSTSSSTQNGPEVGEFGQASTYADGLEVTVGQPEPFTPSAYAAGTETHSQFVQFDVTYTNGTGKVYDPTMMMLDVTSGGSAGEQVFDSENGMGGALDASKVLPGDSITITVAFGVTDPGDMDVQVTPDFKYNTSFFGTK